MSESNKCCDECRCPDTCDQPGPHCRVIENGKPACPCHSPIEVVEWESLFKKANIRHFSQDTGEYPEIDGVIWVASDDVKSFISSLLSQVRSENQDRVIDLAWEYTVEATRLESWSKKEMKQHIEQSLKAIE